MSEIHILRPAKVKEDDNLSIAEAKKKLSPCPICGAKAFLSKDIVDGFYFGWSVGCPRFCLNDGIHGIDENAPREKYLSIFNLDSANECVEKWNRKADEYSGGSESE